MSDLNFSEIGRKIQSLISTNGTQDAPKDEELKNQKKETETLFDFNISDNNIDADDLYNGMVSLNNTQKSETSAPKAKAKGLTAKDSSEKTVKFSNGKTITLNDGEISKTNSDGSVEITSSDKKTVTKYNKNGVKISEVATRTVNSGKISKVETEKFFDAQGNITKEVATAYDKDGEVSYVIENNSSSDSYPLVMPHGPHGVRIQFNADGAKFVPEKGQNIVINKDGTVSVTSNDGNTVTKYDKNGVLSNTKKTQIAEDGTKTVTYTTNPNKGTTWINTVTTTKNNKTTDYVYTVFDKDGNKVTERVKSDYENGKAGLDVLKGYAKDGSVNYEVKDSLLGDSCPSVTSWSSTYATITFDNKGTKKVTIKTGDKAEIDKDGKVTVTKQDGTVKRYDKEGNEIKNEVITFSNGKTLELAEGETVETDFDNYGSVMVTSADGNLKTVYNKKGLITCTTLTEILHDGGKKVTRTDYIVNNRLETTKPGTVTEIGYTKEGYTRWVDRYCGAILTSWEYYDFDENGNASGINAYVYNNDNDEYICRAEGFSLNGAYPTISNVNNNSIEIKFSDDPNDKLVIGKGQWAETLADGYFEIGGNGNTKYYNKEGKEVYDLICFSGCNKVLELKNGETYTQNADRSAEVTSADGKTVTKYDENGLKTSEVKTERIFDNEGNITKTIESTTSYVYNGDDVASTTIERTFNETGDLIKFVEKLSVNDELQFTMEKYSDEADYPKILLDTNGFYGGELIFGEGSSSKSINLRNGESVLIASDGTTVITDKSGGSNAYAKTGENFFDYVSNLLTKTSRVSSKAVGKVEEYSNNNTYRKEIYNEAGQLISRLEKTIDSYTVEESITNYYTFNNSNTDRKGACGYSDEDWLKTLDGILIKSFSGKIYSREPELRIINEVKENYYKPSITHSNDGWEHTYTGCNKKEGSRIYYSYDEEGNQRVFETIKLEGTQGKFVFYGDDPGGVHHDHDSLTIADSKLQADFIRNQYLSDEKNSPYIEVKADNVVCYLSRDFDDTVLITQTYVEPAKNNQRTPIGEEFYTYDSSIQEFKCDSSFSSRSDFVLTPYFYYNGGDPVVTEMWREIISKGYIKNEDTVLSMLYPAGAVNEEKSAVLETLNFNLGSFLMQNIHIRHGELDYYHSSLGDMDSLRLVSLFNRKEDILTIYSEANNGWVLKPGLHTTPRGLLHELIKINNLVYVTDGIGKNSQAYKIVDYKPKTGMLKIAYTNTDGRTHLMMMDVYDFLGNVSQHNNYVAAIPSKLGKIVYPELY